LYGGEADDEYYFLKGKTDVQGHENDQQGTYVVMATLGKYHSQPLSLRHEGWFRLYDADDRFPGGALGSLMGF
jgi:hypothetical protein